MQRIVDRDVVSALLLFLVGGIFQSQMGTGMEDWIFPQVLTYLIISIGALLLLRVVLAALARRAPDLLRISREERGMVIDVVVFCVIAVTYMLVVNGLGFWLSSFLMLSLTSLYLSPQKTRRNVTLAIVVPLVACILAYIVFLHVFYVPVPTATWWPGVD
jgi:uncharacterized membrane protein YfcA